MGRTTGRKFCPNCRKVLYKNESLARRMLAAMPRDSSSFLLSVYRCPAEPGYHFGHSPRARAAFSRLQQKGLV
jgi:hypothetical protein